MGEGIFDRLLTITAEYKTRFVHRIYNKNLRLGILTAA